METIRCQVVLGGPEPFMDLEKTMESGIVRGLIEDQPISSRWILALVGCLVEGWWEIWQNQKDWQSVMLVRSSQNGLKWVSIESTNDYLHLN